MNLKRIMHTFNRSNYHLMSSQRALVCAYCVASFSIQEANEPCAYNKSYKSEQNYSGVEVPAEVKGQKMHFWVEARKEHRPIPDMNAHFLVKNPQKKQFKNSLAAIRAISINLKHYDIEKLQDKAYLS